MAKKRRNVSPSEVQIKCTKCHQPLTAPRLQQRTEDVHLHCATWDANSQWPFRDKQGALRAIAHAAQWGADRLDALQASFAGNMRKAAEEACAVVEEADRTIHGNNMFLRLGTSLPPGPNRDVWR